MPLGARVIILLAGLTLFVLVFEMVRKGRFREELSVVWLVLSVVVASGAFLDRVIDPIAKRIGIYYPPTLVFLFVFILLLLALLYFSIVTSDLKGKVKELSQKVAMLEFQVRESNGGKPS